MSSSPMVSANCRELPDLLTTVARVTDSRDPRSVRYPFAGLLAVAVCVVLTEGEGVRRDR